MILAAPPPIRIATNPWPENATLNAVMHRMGWFESFGVATRLVEVEGVAGPFEAVAAGAADICMISGYGRTVPRIAAGAPVRVVGAAMRKTALVVMGAPDIRALSDLAGRRLAVGPAGGTLHMVMQQALAGAGVPADRVVWCHVGSNAACYRAAERGEVDACCASVANMTGSARLHPVPGGALWQALPDTIFQCAFAGLDALARRRAALCAVMAAHGAMFEFLMSPGSWAVFAAARRDVAPGADPEGARNMWAFFQSVRPYAPRLALSAVDIAALQAPWVANGTIPRVLPVAKIADIALGGEAAALLGPGRLA